MGICHIKGSLDKLVVLRWENGRKFGISAITTCIAYWNVLIDPVVFSDVESRVLLS
jgi:hypothetical protein